MLPHSQRLWTRLTYRADADEELVVIGDSNDREVCYGRIDNAKVQAHAIPIPQNLTALFGGGTTWPAMKISLRRHPGKDNIIRVIDPSGKDFGNIDIKTARGCVLALAFANIEQRNE